jgi:hypothetical protein
MAAAITWRVVRCEQPALDEDPDYRGRGVLAVPGDVLAVSTPDDVLTGEPVGEVLPDTTGFYPLTASGEIYPVSRGALANLGAELG